MPNDHMLNLVSLAGEPVDSYALYSFRGREAFSEPFEYVIQVYTDQRPDLTQWIGKLAEFTVAPGSAEPRSFAGRIYGAHAVTYDGRLLIEVRIGPAYLCMAFERLTHIFQDMTSLAIFAASTKDQPGLVTTVSVSPAPPVRGTVGRIDEVGLDFLARLLANDGIFYYFTYDRDAGGIYRHRMIVSNQTSDYFDLDASPVPFDPLAQFAAISEVERAYLAEPRRLGQNAFNQNDLDAPYMGEATSSLAWGKITPFKYNTIGFEAVAAADVTPRVDDLVQHAEQLSDVLRGNSGEHTLCVAGRLQIDQCDMIPSGKIVLTSVNHAAVDPWMTSSDEPARYSNSFTAMDAARIWRPALGEPRKTVAGPIVGAIKDKSSNVGDIVIDKQSRVPVGLLGNTTYGTDDLPNFFWIPVQQQWSHATHGAQFFPRIGARVIIDFLFGNPDLPFVSGSVYTPNNPYPFDPTATPTQSGWRSVTEGNGSIKQEFHFDDKKGAEEVYLYTGRNYRRQIDADELSTIGHDQTEEVQNDQTLTVKNDQKITVKNDQTESVEGKVTVDITKTQTVTVTDKATFESKKEIEIKVGPCSIKLTMTGIEIKAPKIQVNADATIDIKAGAQMNIDGGGMLNEKAAMVNISGDGVTAISGGIVKIN